MIKRFLMILVFGLLWSGTAYGLDKDALLIKLSMLFFSKLSNFDNILLVPKKPII